MKKSIVFILMAMLLSTTILAATQPKIVQCGIEPKNVKIGDDFSIFADVVDKDGFSDISKVGIFHNNNIILELEKSGIPGRYQSTFNMPVGAETGTYTLQMTATDLLGQSSIVQPFVFTIINPFNTEPVTINSPEDGASLGLQRYYLVFLDRSGG